MRIIGLDPGLRRTGWGVIEADGNRLVHVAHGRVAVDADQSLAERLRELYEALGLVIQEHGPGEAAVEETFVNKNPGSTLKLGQARGAVLLAAATAGLAVAEYTPNLVKKSVVGTGHAEKQQIQAMVRILLPGVARPGAAALDTDAADALAVAICHAQLRASENRLAAALAGSGA